jgi:putative acetyltransferase
MNEFTIRAERPGDEAAIAAVHQAAFESAAEPRLASALREGGFVRVSLVAECKHPADGAGTGQCKIVGHILFSELRIVAGKESRPALALAPLAVLPTQQRQGIGTDLVVEGLSACRADGHEAVFVLGHLDYYPRFGFSPELASRFECAYAGPHFMALELQPGALERVGGRIEYPRPFSEL